MNTIYLNAKDVPSYLRIGYTGKKFRVEVSNKGYIPNTAGLWDGGSRDTYRLIELATGRSVPISDARAPWDPSRTETTFEMRPGFAVVCHSMFCGKDAGLTFTIHPYDAPKMLPAAGEPLTPFETLVLNATASYKSSYNGQDRYQMAYNGKHTKDNVAAAIKQNTEAMEKHGDVLRKDGKRLSERITELQAITEFYPTRDEWETAKQSLIARHLLNKAGAITPEGRNAVAR